MFGLFDFARSLLSGTVAGPEPGAAGDPPHTEASQETASLVDRIERLLREQAGLRQQVAEKERLLQEKEHMLAWFRRQLFGARSERRILEVQEPADQLWLGMQLLEPSPTPPEPATTVSSYERKRRRNPTTFAAPDSQLRFDETVPVEEIVIPDPELEGVPESEIEVISERVTYRLAQRQGPYVVLKFIQKVWKRKGESKPSCPSLPPAVIEGSSADVSFLAGLLIDKFRYHLPLYRQHQRLEQSGVYVDRGTLTRLVHRTGELMESIYHALFSSVLSSEVLTADESPTPAGRGKGKMNSGYYWVFYGDKDEVAFLFSPSRGQQVVDEALAEFQGTLLSDGYGVYESFAERHPGVVHAQCWSHTRRYFVKAEKAEPKKVQQVIRWIQQLYEVEERAKELPDDEKLRLRQEHSKPIVKTIFEFLEKELSETALLPSNPFIKAAEYAVARKDELQVFLDDPRVPLDTNHVERTLRPQAVGRKNWMFHVTEVGARHGAIFYSLIQSCILCGVDPTVYFIDILQRIDFHPARDVHLLTPRLWKEHFGNDPLCSVLSLPP